MTHCFAWLSRTMACSLDDALSFTFLVVNGINKGGPHAVHSLKYGAPLFYVNVYGYQLTFIKYLTCLSPKLVTQIVFSNVHT